METRNTCPGTDKSRWLAFRCTGSQLDLPTPTTYLTTYFFNPPPLIIPIIPNIALLSFIAECDRPDHPLNSQTLSSPTIPPPSLHLRTVVLARRSPPPCSQEEPLAAPSPPLPPLPFTRESMGTVTTVFPPTRPTHPLWLPMRKGRDMPGAIRIRCDHSHPRRGAD